MNKGKYRINIQKGVYGFFGEIELELEKYQITSIEFRIDISHIRHFQQYQNSIKFGLNYAMNRINSHERILQNYRIRILSVLTLPVDSSPTVLSYVAAKAFFNAINFDSEYPKVGEENGEIIFTK